MFLDMPTKEELDKPKTTTLSVPVRYREAKAFVRDHVCRRLCILRPERLAVAGLLEMYETRRYAVISREKGATVERLFRDAWFGLGHGRREEFVPVGIIFNPAREEDMLNRIFRDYEKDVARDLQIQMELPSHGDTEARMVLAMIYLQAQVYRARGKMVL